MHTAYRRSLRLEADRLVLDYLGPRDEAWLRALLDECARLAGRRQSELRERLQEPLPISAPRNKLRLATKVLERMLPEPPQREPSPREVRSRLFRAAAEALAPRRQIIERVASQLRVEVERVEDSLFADLAGQRRLKALPQDLSPSRLALLTNQSLVLACLKRAERVRLTAWGGGHALVRHARALGLICLVSKARARGPAPRKLCAPENGEPAGVALEISGPFALFRKTEVYGRSLASLLPRAARCQHFELEADCVLARGAERTTLHVSPYDPVFPARDPAPLTSRSEARFARDFAKLALAWEIVRDPAPVEVDGSLVFPGFALVHREQPRRRWLLEIVGFWTAEYLRRRLLDADLPQLILCVDDARRCSETDLPPHARVLRYEGRLQAAAVLELIDREQITGAASPTSMPGVARCARVVDDGCDE